jgi:hypothetical protein
MDDKTLIERQKKFHKTGIMRYNNFRIKLRRRIVETS